MDIIKELAKLIPIVRDGPVWLQLMFAAALLTSAVFVVALLIYIVSRGASIEQFAVESPRDGQYILGHETAIEGKALPPSDQLHIEVTRIENGQRTKLVDADANPDRRPDGAWRYQWVRFPSPGDFEIIVRVTRAGKNITYIGPLGVHVGEWSKAPQISGSEPVVEVSPSKEYPDDLSPYVHRIYDQGGEGSSPAFAAITAMEVAFAVAGSPRSLSARYVNDKAKLVEQQPLPSGDVYGIYFTSIAYVVQKFGAPPASVWPYASDLHALPRGLDWKELDELASENRVRLLGPIPIDDIPKELHSGRPLIAAVNAYNLENTWFKSSTGVIDETPKGNSFGAHVVAIVGFDARDGSIKFANSWGAKWGRRGFGFLTKAAARAYLEPDEIWAVEAVTR